jgi:hypothetical protein
VSFLEVLSWYVETKQNLTSFPHGDSQQWDDLAIGSMSLSGAIEVKLIDALTGDATPMRELPFTPAKVVQLVLQNAVVTLTGAAAIESTPISTKIDGGEPVSATYRFRSKLAWSVSGGTGYDG